MGLCSSKRQYRTDLSVEEIEAIREVWIKGVNFGADNWLVFKRVAVDQVTTGFSDTTSDPGLNGMMKPDEEMMNLYSNENCLARLGWNKLMTVIVREMKRGFLEEAMRNCKEEDNKDIFRG
nr:Protein GLB-17, isoform b [Haemonchus contortus]